ncbi:MAG TPA: hypothetical protein VK034_03425, partial [Enhygromyxa sp.]|nr:hypothetical protein [Enhygromyxa sp.]
MTRTLIGSLTVLGFVVALTACKTDGSGNDVGIIAEPIPEEELPEQSAGALCELIFGCSCESPNYPDEPSCVETRSDLLNQEQLAAQAAGLTYDAQCAGDLLALAEADGCATQVALDCDTFCAAYHGDLGVDQPCMTPVDTQPTWSDCAQGLWCIASACQNPCGAAQTFLGVGEACRDAEGQSLGVCDPGPGLFCDFETGTCIALPGIGEPCYGSEVCGVGATCDWSTGEAICVALPGAGEACTYECDAGLYCDGVDGQEGTCVTLPGEGQPCGP